MTFRVLGGSGPSDPWQANGRMLSPTGGSRWLRSDGESGKISMSPLHSLSLHTLPRPALIPRHSAMPKWPYPPVQEARAPTRFCCHRRDGLRGLAILALSSPSVQIPSPLETLSPFPLYLLPEIFYLCCFPRASLSPPARGARAASQGHWSTRLAVFCSGVSSSFLDVPFASFWFSLKFYIT